MKINFKATDRFARPRMSYVWLDTLPETNENLRFVPVVERYTYCTCHDYLEVLSELLIVYALRVSNVVGTLPNADFKALIRLQLPEDEHLLIDMRPYGYDRNFYLMTRKRFRLFKRHQALLFAEDCQLL